jgi:YGGT family
MSNDRMTEVKSIQQEPERDEQRIFTFKVTQLIWLFLGILEALIVLRIGLKLIGANPASPIVALIYGFTYLFLFPFEGMVVTPSAGSMVLELSSLFAMLIYALIAWAVERTVWLLFYRPRGPVVGTTQTTTSERHINP